MKRDCFSKWTVARLAAAVAFLSLSSLVHAGEGTLGIAFNQVQDETSLGAVLDYETALSDNPVNITAQLQVGDLHRARAHASIALPAFGTNVKAFADSHVKGYDVEDLATQTDLGVGIEIPNTPIGVGLAGRNTANDLTALGYDPAGLTFDEGRSLHAIVFAEFDLDAVHARLRVLPQLIGDGGAAHQAHLNLATDIDAVSLGFDISAQTRDGKTEYETATHVSLAIKL